MSDKKSSMFSIIGASSVGTMIEWYDFYIFGSLATIISTKFFPAGPGSETLSFLSTLATFAAGFVVRPFGALFFGRLGDLIGRKYTFMVTLLLMGSATFIIGCIPSYETIGVAAPLLVLLLRLLQGLALGGEYGGAATYVAEHSPTNERGYMTSWIQITATAGLIVSLIVIAITKISMSKESFEEFGWRIPFLFSIVMVGVSYIIRRNMHESPLFSKAKAEGKTSTNPLKESFGKKLNFKFVLLALLGVTMGQGVVWYTGQFYAMSFVEKIMNVPKEQVDSIMIWGLCLGTPFFVVFGWLSDRIGRKWIMLAGMLVAILSYRSIYSKMYDTADIKKKTEILEKTTSIAELKENKKNKNGGVDSVYTVTKAFTDGTTYKEVKTKTLKNGVVEINEKDGKPIVEIKKTVTINDTDKWTLIWLIFVQMLFVTMVYGPVAAFLVEMFPTKIRYTSMSLPYHIGNGIFGGLLPAIATFLVSNATKLNTDAVEAGLPKIVEQPYLEGLWYPIIIAGICFVIGAIYLDGKDNKVND
ncbi:General substrate transporter [Emticicia oligotrophica DSM 17448]|uniref:General substrate transporter n=1 Tax=Emticicia oligotrophica (strain DSM 17448 / CIP 109782 / MTCC 6937 / GPTSA100-15) TaxID=929562 RepID=A0ABM5N5W9_EMTOG|nr:MFS transporter [Emticicia oligotrophica]AFK04927.1 General substrate transporter [Emticicia oligotrophica DSM 17448]